MTSSSAVANTSSPAPSNESNTAWSAIKWTKKWPRKKVVSLLEIMSSIREEIRQGRLGTGKFIVDATRRLNDKLSCDPPMMRTQVKQKWRILKTLGVAQPMTVASITETEQSNVGTPVAKKRKWTSRDDDQLSDVMTGEGGLLTHTSIPSDVYVQAAKRLRGKLSFPVNANAISQRWRRYVSPAVNQLAPRESMNPAQMVKWNRSVASAKSSGSKPKIANLGKRFGVNPNSLRRLWKDEQKKSSEKNFEDVCSDVGTATQS